MFNKIILGPGDTEKAKKYIGRFCWFRTTLEKAKELPTDNKYAKKLTEVMEGLEQPYSYGSPNKFGCSYIVVLEVSNEQI